MTILNADARFDAFWADVDLEDAVAARVALEAILSEVSVGKARAAYERASLHDSLGEEDAAVPLYRWALANDLDAHLRTQATVQLASTLRNLGDASGAIALLRSVPADDELADSVDAFSALALFDDGKPTEALRTALRTLAPHLPRYTRAVGAYAGELRPVDRVRTIAVGVLIQNGWVLAEAYRGHGDSGPFLRAPGGGVIFGESADEAIRREFTEELGVHLEHARLLGVTENIFDAHGKRGHEIVFAYAIRCPDLEALPRTDRLPVRDADTDVGWYEIDALDRLGLPFYPDGVLELAV